MSFVYKLLNTNILVFIQKNTRRQNSVKIFWCIMYKSAQLFLCKIFIKVITQKKKSMIVKDIYDENGKVYFIPKITNPF